MKILQLCKKFPYPVKDGESLAILNLGEALASQGAEIFMLAMNTSRHWVEVEKEADALQIYTEIKTAPVDNRIKIGTAFLNLFSSQSYHISRFIDPAFEKALVKLLKDHSFDIVQLETLYLTPFIPLIRQHSNAKVALRSHNVEFEIWERIVRNTPWGIKKIYLSYLTNKLKRYEISQLHAFDLLIAITERDRKRLHQLGFSGQDITIPIGLNTSTYQPDWKTLVNTGPLELSFIGSLDWMPNVEGLKWFLDHIWEDLKKEFPETRLHIAGRNTPSWIRQINDSGIVVHGEVQDARAFINTYPLMIVPLLSGGGMRVKIIEAMALGRVVLTTKLGLEGIPASHMEEVLIADTPYEFLNTIAQVQKNKELEYIGKNARRLIERRFDSHLIGQELLQAYELLTMTTV